ncbi:hypothetical protein LDENG_00136830 [Lucifuga dentata]|nr:hypothetical protein LDENG_00136830 [Lucifuga dentata]
MEASGSSRLSSRKSSLSESSKEGKEEEEYADDFTSFNSSGGCSPNPVSSPEPAGAQALKSPLCADFSNSDSGSQGIQKRTVLPVPIKACSSPQRSLRGTHIIRPRTQASVLSFSSSDDDRDVSASIQTVRSRKQRTESSRAERSPGAESLASSRGRDGDSSKNSNPLRRLSTESKPSFDPYESEELEDELGSLDFRNEYQHISQLVTNKLPGYTM